MVGKAVVNVGFGGMVVTTGSVVGMDVVPVVTTELVLSTLVGKAVVSVCVSGIVPPVDRALLRAEELVVTFVRHARFSTYCVTPRASVFVLAGDKSSGLLWEIHAPSA